jgi:hypothetical protein
MIIIGNKIMLYIEYVDKKSGFPVYNEAGI